MSSDLEEQQDELLALLSIFDPDEFIRNESRFSGEFRVCVELPQHFSITLKEGDAVSQYEVSSLPPLCLTFDLPEDYPSCSAPSYSLNCCWLGPTQLSSLTTQLDDLYQTTGGAVVLFSWAQFLKHEALDFLGIRDVLEITSKEDTTEEDDSVANMKSSGQDVVSQDKNKQTSEENKSATASSPSEATNNSDRGASNVARLKHKIPSLTPGQVLLSRLLIHDAAQRAKAFSSQQFDCGVCFTSWIGADCIQLIKCGHVFCRACFAEFCKVQITEGNVKEVTCLEASCEAAPTQAQVRSLVGEELFNRYDRLLLQSSLDSMPDVMYCPRPSCASAVLTDSSSSMALCTVCSFAFCVRCKKTYHGPEDCYAPKKKMASQTNDHYAEIPQSKEGMQALWEDYTTGTKPRRRLLEGRYGKHILLGFLEDCLSEDWIAFNSKICPHCFSNIEKNGGCNHMTCSQCNRHFCWICLGKWPNCNCGPRQL